MKKKAFTMVEILIVLFIFWVGILAVLNVLTNSLSYFDNISTKTKASFLAKEGLEIAYNFRDGRIEEGLPWNYLTWNCPEYYLWDNGYNYFKIGFWTGDKPYRIFEQGPVVDTKTDFAWAFNQYNLELYTWSDWMGYYIYNTKNASSPLPAKWFARYITFTWITAEDGATLDPNKILKISSHALYKRGNLTGEIVLESFIGIKDTIPAERTVCN